MKSSRAVCSLNFNVIAHLSHTTLCNREGTSIPKAKSVYQSFYTSAKCTFLYAGHNTASKLAENNRLQRDAHFFHYHFMMLRIKSSDIFQGKGLPACFFLPGGLRAAIMKNTTNISDLSIT